MIDANQHPLADNFQDCTGCAACAAVCPADAIAMRADAEGFVHPRINPERCNGCDLCRSICPVNRPAAALEPAAMQGRRISPPRVLAAWHTDESIRRESSSGGVFSALADYVLARGGAAAGAAFDGKLAVRHVLVEHPAELPRLRGSKYVQSDLPPDFHRQLRRRLQAGQALCFAGTPCQVAGLQSYLQRDYANLYCCDLVCHGVPSPLLFEAYLGHRREKEGALKGVSFRSKAAGWKNFQVAVELPDGTVKRASMLADPFMAAFLYNYSLRPCCYACRFASPRRFGDLTLGDFWGVAMKYPEYDRDDRGTSLVLVNTERGTAWLDACRPSLFLGPADLRTALSGNSTLDHPADRPSPRATFYHDLQKLPFAAMIRKYRLHPPPMFPRLLAEIRRRIAAAVRRAFN